VKRLSRGAAVLVLLGGLFALGVDAAETNRPTISGLSTYVVTGGQQLTITGDHFSSDISTGDCGIHGAPTVRFYPFNNAGHIDVPGRGNDAANCTNGMVKVNVPPSLSGAARVSVVDYHGQESNTGPGGFQPTVTVQPVASVNPSAGQVGTTATIQGANLKPPTKSNAAASTIPVSVGSASISGSWGPSSISFQPGTSSGEVQVSFSVFTDAGDQGNPAKLVNVLVDAGNFSFLPPSLDATGLGRHVVGDRLTLPGHNLGPSGSITFPGGLRGGAVSWSSSSVGVTIPAGAQPGALTAFVTGFGNIAGPPVSLDPKAGALSPASGSASQRVTITGYNFGTTAGTITVGSATQVVNSWTDQSATFTISPDTDGGATTLARADGAAVSLGNLSIVPHLDKVESNNVPSGAQVVVDGASLGAEQGRATVGATDAQPLLWSRTSVLLQVPTTLAPGTYPIVVTSASGAASNPVSLTILPGPSTAPTARTTQQAGAPTGIGGALAPSFDNNHTFVKPIKPPSPVYFNVSVDPHTLKAGETASITVTLKLNDKPLKGAEVKLAMLFTPGDDYRFSPESGVTDADGVFKATVQTSKNPGDSIIAATSGVFSDQDHVTGTGKAVAGAPTQANPAAQGGGFAPLLALGVAAVALVAAGFYLNVRSMGS
jgi:hypothetical protein